MSCYIYFYLKKKDTPTKDWKLCLAHLCTSDARELATELESFGSGVTYEVHYDKEDDPMYGHCTPLTDELLDNTIKYYDFKVQELEKSKRNYIKEWNEAKENYLKATSKVVLDDLKETITNAKGMIDWCIEEIENFTALKSYICDAVRDVLDENAHYDYNKETNQHTKVNDYELVYYMG